MKIWYVTSECAPFSKSGGLADVGYSLPPVLRNLGEDAWIITPLYGPAEKYGEAVREAGDMTVELRGESIHAKLYRGDRGGAPVIFIGQQELFGRDRLYGYGDDAWRFAFFCQAVITLLTREEQLPDILHLNDWETAAAALYLKDMQEQDGRYARVRTVFTIHNMAFQGQYAREKMHSVFGLDEKWYERGLIYHYQGREDINLMKAAMMVSDAVTTVSPTYARELHLAEFGEGLEGVIEYVDGKLYGILNGIDEKKYDPRRGEGLPAAFSAMELNGKAVCKRAVQEKFGLRKEPEWPLVAIVARLAKQKGFDLIREALPGLMEMGIQMVVFGQGDEEYAGFFRWARERWPGQMGFSDEYTEETAQLIFAGADFYLMPSRFEPCGLSQMMAMRYGTIPIVRETGGLRDSVRPYSSFDGIGEGFSFSEYASKEMYLAVMEAVKIYLADPETFARLRQRCMIKDFSWERSAQEYRRMYAEISVSGAAQGISFQEAFENIRAAYERVDAVNREHHPERREKGFRRVMEIELIGEGAGWLYIEIDDDGYRVEPWSYHDADAHIRCRYRDLMRMMRGETTAPRLFMKGRMKITGNLAKGFEMKHLLTPHF